MNHVTVRERFGDANETQVCAAQIRLKTRLEDACASQTDVKSHEDSLQMSGPARNVGMNAPQTQTCQLCQTSTVQKR